VLAPGGVQDQATIGATWKTASHHSFSFFYGHAFGKTLQGDNSIPASFGGGNRRYRRLATAIKSQYLERGP
jgi:long-chain fatty acid transport protein